MSNDDASLSSPSTVLPPPEVVADAAETGVLKMIGGYDSLLPVPPAVKIFCRPVDARIVLHDSGLRTADGRPVPDTELIVDGKSMIYQRALAVHDEKGTVISVRKD